MNIAIIGAGIIGVTTAYELATDGHAVTVFERHSSIAEEASFANAGIISPAWAVAPFDGQQNGKTRLVSSLHWAGGSKKPEHPGPHEASLDDLLRLGLYSRYRFQEISSRLAYTFDRKDGHLVLLRNQNDFRQAQPRLMMARELGISFHEISALEARQIEPALHLGTPLAGAIYFPQDEVANCRQFAVILRDAAEQLGARFDFNASVSAVDDSQPITLQIEGRPAFQRFDAVVLCTGGSSQKLLKPLGVHLPLAPVHGHSISARISEPGHAPRSGVTDEHHQVSITRLGQRVRVASLTHRNAASGRAVSANPDRTLRILFEVLADWYPQSALLSRGVQTWKGASPSLSDGLPVIGESRVPGVWLNLGHGRAGWTLACGSARVLADRIGGRTPQTPTHRLNLDRSAL